LLGGAVQARHEGFVRARNSGWVAPWSASATCPKGVIKMTDVGTRANPFSMRATVARDCQGMMKTPDALLSPAGKRRSLTGGRGST
jgi:hypothetical protein